MHILIADDHAQNRFMLQAALEAQGWSVETAINGREALEKAQASPPDLIISDILMPEMDGFALCRLWRGDEKLARIPFIFYTSTYTDHKDEEFALSLGADRFLLKPMDPTQWPSVIRQTLEVSQARYNSASPTNDPVVLQSYNAVLVHKLEQKLIDLERAQAELRSEIEERRRMEAALRQVETTLRESEARARAIADNNPTGIYMAGTDGQIRYVNRALQAIIAVGRPVLGSEWIQFVAPEDRARVVNEWERYVQRKTHEFSIEYTLVATNGTRHHVFEKTQPIVEGNRTIGYVGSIQDLTDRRRAESERAALEAQLRQAQKLEAIGTLAGGVAHDFNNILSAILGNVELARFDLPNSHPVQHSLDEVKKASIRAQNLVRQILAFSRKQPVTKKVTSLPGVIDEAVSILRAGMPRSVDLRVQIDPDTPEVLADPTQIHQVITNLCTNSWQAMDNKAGVIDVSTSRVTIDGQGHSADLSLLPGAYACIKVSDTGKGIEKDHLDRIFEPFFTTKPVGQGTGLGLSVAHGIVRSHGGSISVASKVGQGTVFTIYLPEASRPFSAHPFPAATEEPLPRGNNQHILYLDDEEQLVYLAKRFLERIGYRVTAFTRPMDAIKAATAHPEDFHLVVTDFSMPDMSGIEVATQLRQIAPNLPVVLASGHVTEQLEHDAKAVGVSEVFYKPDSVEGLCRTIHRLATRQGV